MNRALGVLKPHFIAMLLLVAGALGAGWFMLPGESERIAMLELDGKNREALRILEQRFAAGDRRHRTLFQLQYLYEQFGDLAKARQMLELLARARPRDAQVQGQLATFYKMTQNSSGYTGQLEAQIAARYSEPACRELIAIQRLKGDFAAEKSAIDYCRRRGYRRTEDMLRLASLEASAGNTAVASILLRNIDDLRRLRDPHDRLQLFSMLLKGGQARDAERRALRWLRGGHEESFALALVEMLTTSGMHQEALHLARAAGTPGDLISLAVADVLLETDQVLAARTYLKGWIESSNLRDAEMAGHFIAIALDAEDPILAFEGANSYGLGKLGQGDLVSLAAALGATRRTQEFAHVIAAMSEETLAANPLLIAASSRSQSTETLRALLRHVTVGELDAWRLALWSELMGEAGRSLAAAEALERLGIAEGSVETVEVETGSIAPPVRSVQASQPSAVKPIRRAKRQRRINAVVKSPAASLATIKKAPAAATRPLPQRKKAAPRPAAGATQSTANAETKSKSGTAPWSLLFK